MDIIDLRTRRHNVTMIQIHKICFIKGIPVYAKIIVWIQKSNLVNHFYLGPPNTRDL